MDCYWVGAVPNVYEDFFEATESPVLVGRQLSKLWGLGFRV